LPALSGPPLAGRDGHCPPARDEIVIVPPNG
jgi:hypothetical protein